jgi:site-specific recombinase XerD
MESVSMICATASPLWAPGRLWDFRFIGKLLGHSQPSTTQRYVHLDADPMRRAAETIGSTIAAAMAGKRQ